MPDSQQREDALLLKRKLGVQIVRTSHYPQAPAFLDSCDEIGLLVFTEIPGWQHIGKESPGAKTTLQHVREMVLAGPEPSFNLCCGECESMNRLMMTRSIPPPTHWQESWILPADRCRTEFQRQQSA